MTTSVHLAVESDQSQTNSVRVENISTRATFTEIVALFNTFIGDVRNSQDCKDLLGSYLEITFFSQDAARKALNMSGYMHHGTALVVNPVRLPHPQAQHKGQVDNRRNLYVLGIPFSITKPEFSALFSRYGTVSHCVILATLDNSSRRRGFVVMSCHNEAKLAMASLAHTQVKGHTLDISWAVVQRSQGKIFYRQLNTHTYILTYLTGFLDGGDRTIALESPLPNLPHDSCTQDNSSEIAAPTSADSSTSSITSDETDLTSLSPSPVPTPILLVTNLPMLLFSQPQDMHPLFYPYGRIKKLEVINSPVHGSTSAMVEYVSTGIAQEAKENIHGQCYAGYWVSVHYLRSKSSFLDLASVSTATSYNTNVLHNLVPFVRQSSFLPGLAGSHYGPTHSQRFNNGSRYVSSGPRYTHPRATHLTFRSDHQLRNSKSSTAISRRNMESSRHPPMLSQLVYPNHNDNGYQKLYS